LFCWLHNHFGISFAPRAELMALNFIIAEVGRLWPLKTDIVPGQLNSVSQLFISHWRNELYGFPYLQGK